MRPFTHVRNQVVSGATTWDEALRKHRWEIPEFYNITGDIVDSWASSPGHAERAALAVLDDAGAMVEVSWSRLRGLTQRLGNALISLGIARGDVVTVILTQSVEAAVAQLATYRIGAVACPVSHLYAGDALVWRLRHSGTRVVVTDRRGAETVAEHWSELPDLQHIVTVGGSIGRGTSDFWEVVDNAAEDGDPADTLADDPALLIYTSGTTGEPKGVLHGHRVVLGHANASYLLEGIDETDSYWSPNDWSWIAGVGNGLLAPLGFGATVLSMGGRRFDPHEAAEFISTYRPTVGYLPVSGMRLMRQAGVSVTSKYRAILTGGEVLSDDLRDWCIAHVATTINNGFGQTEGNDTLGVVSSWERPTAETVGRVLPGHETRIVGADGRDVPDGEEGELLLREAGRPVFLLEYFKNPEATQRVKEGGWIHTGDTVSRDELGYFHFAGRRDDVIKSSGYRIGPSEIETVVDGHPDVLECVVIGLPDEERGQIVTAVVRLRPHADADAVREQITQMTRSRIGKHAYVRRVEVLPEFPKTVTGKIQRSVVRKQFI